MAGRAIVVTLIWAGVAAATPAGDLTYHPPEPAAAPEIGPLLTRLAAMTLFVVLTCAGLARAARVMQRVAAPKATGSDRLEYLGGTDLDRHCKVHVVRAGSVRIVVAEDATGLRSLQRLPDTFEGELERAGAPGLG